MRRIQENNLFIYRLLNATGRESDNQSPNLQWADAPVCGSPNAENVHAYGRLYAYDKMGNIQSLQQTGTNAFTRLYEYESGKNTLAEITDNDSPPNTLCAFSYDACGNMTQSNTERFYQWDAADQLKSFHIQAGNSEPSIYAQYLYDAGGNRTKKIVRTAGGNYEVTVYVDGVFEYCKKVSGSTQEKNYYHIMDGAQRIAQQRVGTAFPGDITDAVTYIMGDFLGSSNVRLNSSGGLIDREEYYPFGDSSLRTFSSKRYRYVGKEKDQESGLYYYGARYYSAWTCRFISVDPLAAKFADLSPYNYAGNKPINKVDIDGLQEEGRQGTPNGGGQQGGDYQIYLPEVEIRVHSDDPNKEVPEMGVREMYGGLAKIGISTILDFTPGVGTVKGIVEAITGKDLVTGEKLSGFERAMGWIPIVGKIGRGAKAATKVIGSVAAVNDARKAEKGVSNARRGANAVDHLKKEKGILDTKGKKFVVDMGAGKELRYVDNFQVLEGGSKLASEVKVGRVGATAFNKQQVLKDIQLLKDGAVDKIEWNFFTSAKTGKAGPTDKLKDFIDNALKDAGVDPSKFELKPIRTETF